MLLFQLIAFVWTTYISLTGLSFNSENYEKLNGLPEHYYTKEYGAFVVTTMISVGFVLFVGVLFLQYLYLISFNVSLWEATVSHKITYLKPYPLGFHPFDMGFVENLRMVFLHGNQL